MSQELERLIAQLRPEGWVGKKILTVADVIRNAVSGGSEWYFNLPHIKFIMENSVLGNVRELLLAGQDISQTIVSTTLNFMESLHSINRAYNSTLIKDLAGKANSIFGSLASGRREQILYQAAITAHNESLNLPALAEKIQQIEAEINAIQEMPPSQQNQQWQQQAVNALIDVKNQLLAGLESLVGRAKSAAKQKLKQIEKNLAKMTGGSVPEIIDHNPYEISSIYRYSITSTFTRPPVLNVAAIVPVVGGAITVSATAGVITSIASWLLSSFFLKSIGGVAAGLLPALSNTVTSIVLKVMNSTGVDAVRYLAASALKASKNLLPTIFGSTRMEGSAWGFLMSHASLIIGAAVIIIQAMKNKLSTAEMLYVFGNIDEAKDEFHLSQICMYDTDHTECLKYMAEKAMLMYEETAAGIESIIGVGIDSKKKFVSCYDLSNPANPVKINGDEEIATRLGATKLAILASGKYQFSFE